MRARVGWVLTIRRCNSIFGTRLHGDNDFIVVDLAGLPRLTNDISGAIRRLGPVRAVYFFGGDSGDIFPSNMEPISSSDEGDDQGSSSSHRKRKLPRNWEGEPLGRGRPLSRDGSVHEEDSEEPEVLSDSESDCRCEDSEPEDRQYCAECGEHVELCHQGGPSSAPDGRPSQGSKEVKRRREERGVRPSVQPRYHGVRGIGYEAFVLGEPIRPTDPLRHHRARVDGSSGPGDETEDCSEATLGLPPSPLSARRLEESVPERTNGPREDAVREGSASRSDDRVPYGSTPDS